MARQESLSILTTDEGKEMLAEQYGKVIENVQKATISYKIKNMELSGDPEAGSVEAKRFANAEPKAYGTARAAAAGDKVKTEPVTVKIDDDKEIVEELEEKDVKLYGVQGLLERRSRNHQTRMAAYLDKKFFAEAADNANEVQIPEGTPIEEELEMVIQELENTENEFVDGVPRELMHLALSTKYYGKVRNQLDKVSNSNVNSTENDFLAWHGVMCDSTTHLPEGVPYILQAIGSVAQPVMADQYTAEKIPLSNAYGVSLFFSNGTKTVTPDLIFTGVPKTEGGIGG